MPDLRKTILVRAERLCLVGGGLGLLVVVSIYLEGWLGMQQALAEFESGTPTAIVTSATADKPDLRGLPEHDAAVAVLRIPRLGVEVPVFLGTDRRTLNRGAGVVDGTAHPGASGNIVISGHRDSYFRALEQIAAGDLIELQGRDGRRQTFQVGETFVTDPLDVSVLDPEDETVLTLITCHPFRYVGFAPNRFIVRAPLTADGLRQPGAAES